MKMIEIDMGDGNVAWINSEPGVGLNVLDLEGTPEGLGMPAPVLGTKIQVITSPGMIEEFHTDAQFKSTIINSIRRQLAGGGL